MYYKSVNRGLNLTVLGRYLVGLTLGIGALAVITGINGMFIFLGLTLGMLGISGVISEKNLKNCETSVSQIPQFLEAGQPGNISLSIVNKDTNADIFAIETEIALVEPTVRFFRFKSQVVGKNFSVHLAARYSSFYKIRCSDLRRGQYKQIFAIQKTTFPFGIFLKYKVDKVPAKICVLPRHLKNMEETWKNIIDLARIKELGAEDFIGHEAFHPSTPLKFLDWKKNAGLAPNLWVAKKFNQSNNHNTVNIIVQELYLKKITTSSFEKLLSNIRTGVNCLGNDGFILQLVWQNLKVIKGEGAILEFLATIQLDSSFNPEVLDYDKSTLQLIVTEDDVKVAESG